MADVEVKTETKIEEKSNIDPWSMITDVDAEGVPYSWLEVRKQIEEHGILALECVFNWHMDNTPYFDTMTNFYLACTYFDDPVKYNDVIKEITRVEMKARKLIREERKQKPSIVR